MVYLITGKARAGKTTYAKCLVKELQGEGELVWLIDGDEFRKMCDNDDYSDDGRRRNLMAAAEYAQSKEAQGYIVVMAFVSPRKVWRQEMRARWRKSRVIYIPGGKLWKGTFYERPDEEELGEFFHPGPVSLFIGRYQPPHDGHEALIRSVLEEGRSVCVAVRHTPRDESNPYPYIDVKQALYERFKSVIDEGRLIVLHIPDIAEVCYGRKVGWGIREIRLNEEIEEISATKIRRGGG